MTTLTPKIWTRTAPHTNERVAAVICDAFNAAKAYGNSAPIDVANHLRFAMTTDAGKFLPRYDYENACQRCGPTC